MLQTEKEFDFLIFIGRFQPFHFAHKEVIDIAFSMSKQVILVLGSAQDERTIKNPFSIAERKQMILGSFPKADQGRLHFVPIVDLYDDQKWLQAVTSGVQAVIDVNAVTDESVTTDESAAVDGSNTRKNKIGLIGHFKDESSYYLRLFPEWQLVELENLKNALSATPLREKYYRGEIDQEYFPDNVQQFLQAFQQQSYYAKLQQKYQQQDITAIELE